MINRSTTAIATIISILTYLKTMPILTELALIYQGTHPLLLLSDHWWYLANMHLGAGAEEKHSALLQRSRCGCTEAAL